jgi:hypothetical protein
MNQVCVMSRVQHSSESICQDATTWSSTRRRAALGGAQCRSGRGELVMGEF